MNDINRILSSAAIALVGLFGLGVLGGEATNGAGSMQVVQQTNAGPFELAASLRTNVFMAGEPIRLKVSLKNAGTEPRMIPGYKYASDYIFRLEDRRGDSVPMSPAGRRLYAAWGSGGESIELGPAKTESFDFLLNEIYQLPPGGGSFTIRAIRCCPPMLFPIHREAPPPGFLLLTSPPVSFTVLVRAGEAPLSSTNTSTSTNLINPRREK
jgi:hypothetical protein